MPLTPQQSLIFPLIFHLSVDKGLNRLTETRLELFRDFTSKEPKETELIRYFFLNDLLWRWRTCGGGKSE